MWVLPGRVRWITPATAHHANTFIVEGDIMNLRQGCSSPKVIHRSVPEGAEEQPVLRYLDFANGHALEISFLQMQPSHIWISPSVDGKRLFVGRIYAKATRHAASNRSGTGNSWWSMSCFWCLD